MLLFGVMLATVTSTFTDLVGHHPIAAVFSLMAVDALLPVGGELIMLLAGAVAAGAIGSGAGGLANGLPAYLGLATAGSLGYLAGAILGWFVGQRGGRELVARHGRWLHLGPERMLRAEAWFERHGRFAVLFGRLTPLVRSFVSIPAGVLGARLGPYVALTALGSAIWCFGFAGAGWALGDNWDSVHSAFRYVDIAAVVIAVAGTVWLVSRRRSPAT